MNLGVSLLPVYRNTSRRNSCRPDRRLFAILLLLPPLPLQQDPDEVVEIKVGPQSVNEKDLSVLVALPEHKIAEAFHSASSNKDI